MHVSICRLRQAYVYTIYMKSHTEFFSCFSGYFFHKEDIHGDKLVDRVQIVLGVSMLNQVMFKVDKRIVLQHFENHDTVIYDTLLNFSLIVISIFRHHHRHVL